MEVELGMLKVVLRSLITRALMTGNVRISNFFFTKKKLEQSKSVPKVESYDVLIEIFRLKAAQLTA